jgi:hypothetical protein
MDHESAGVRAGETDSGSDGSVIDLHLTDTACAAGARPAAGGVAALSRAGAADGMPFLLGADGSYDVQLNRFFRELDSWGVRAANSVLAYARDIMLFCRFLEQSRGDKSIWQCDTADLRADPGRPAGVSMVHPNGHSVAPGSRCGAQNRLIEDGVFGSGGHPGLFSRPVRARIDSVPVRDALFLRAMWVGGRTRLGGLISWQQCTTRWCQARRIW